MLAVRPSTDQFAAILRTNLPAFVHRVFKTVSPADKYLPNWHIDLICEYLLALRDDQLGANGLIINIPPRYLKSITISVAWPAFLLGHKPTEQIVCSSYSLDLAYEHSMHTRLVMQQPWYQYAFPETHIARDQGAKREFKTTKQGHRQACSVGSGVTGFGGNWLINDDNHDPQQAESDVERQRGINWYRRTWSSRMNDKKRGKLIHVAQRLHERDTAGYLLAEQAENYVHLKIPAVENENRKVYSMGAVTKIRTRGDILHPEREGPKEIKRMKVALGEYGYSGQYQQEPVPEGGGIIKKFWWREWKLEKPPKVRAVFQSYDTAYTERDWKQEQSGAPSYSARTTWGIFDHRISDHETNERPCIMLLEAWRDMVAYPDLKREVERSFKDDVENGTEYDAWLLIEAKASGQALISDLRRQGFPVRTYRPQKYEDKVSRAHMAAPFFEAGMVYYMPRQWAQDVIADIAAFPAGASDDWTDTATQAISFMKRNFWSIHPDDPEDEDEEDLRDEQPRARSYG